MPRNALAALTLATTFALTACDDLGTQPTAPDPGAITLSAARMAAPAPGDSPIAAKAIEMGYAELVGALAYVDAELETGLVDLFLNGTDQYTVFAPTDDAFESLYDLLGSLLEAEIDEIGDLPPEVVLDVLLYHVAEGRRASNSVVPKNRDRTITPLLGEPFHVRSDLSIRDGLTGTGLRDDASIVYPDVSASNGIIHEISGVIVPPSVVAALTGG